MTELVHVGVTIDDVNERRGDVIECRRREVNHLVGELQRRVYGHAPTLDLKFSGNTRTAYPIHHYNALLNFLSC